MKEHEHNANCKLLLGSLSEYIDGDLREELCAQIEEHIQGCENCRIVVDTLRKTIEIYEQTSATAEIPQAVRERLFYRLHLNDYQ